MKAVAVILIVLVIAAVGGIGYLYLNANLTASFESCIVTDTVTQADYFGQLKSQLASDTFTGALFRDTEPGSPEEYQFMTYTVRLRNNAFLDAEVIELRITPMEGDLLQIGTSEEYSLKPGRTMDLSATILSARNSHSIREGTVTCYFWGIPFSTKLTLGR